MKKTLATVAIVLSFGLAASWAANLWELRDGSNVPQIVIDSAKNATGFNDVTATTFYGNGANLTGVVASTVADGSISTGKMATDAITTPALLNGAVTDAKIDSVSGSKVSGNISGNAGTATALAADPSDCTAASQFSYGVNASGTAQCTSVTGGDVSMSVAGVLNIGANAVNTGKLASDAVTEPKVLDGAITDRKITSVSGSKVSGNISGNAGTATALAADPSDCTAASQFSYGVNASGTAQCTSVTGGDVSMSVAGVLNLGSGVVNTAKLATDAVTSPAILNGAVTAAKLGASSVETSKLAADAVTTTKVLDLAITNAKINDVAASKVSAGAFSGSFSFGSAMTVNNLEFLGALSAATIRATSCTGGAGKCMVLNSTDFDLYTSTGASAGQFRNSRTGVGP